MTQSCARFNVGHADVAIIEAAQKNHLLHVQEDGVWFHGFETAKRKVMGQRLAVTARRTHQKA